MYIAINLMLDPSVLLIFHWIVMFLPISTTGLRASNVIYSPLAEMGQADNQVSARKMVKNL